MAFRQTPTLLAAGAVLYGEQNNDAQRSFQPHCMQLSRNVRTFYPRVILRLGCRLVLLNMHTVSAASVHMHGRLAITTAPPGNLAFMGATGISIHHNAHKKSLPAVGGLLRWRTRSTGSCADSSARDNPRHYTCLCICPGGLSERRQHSLHLPYHTPHSSCSSQFSHTTHLTEQTRSFRAALPSSA